MKVRTLLPTLALTNSKMNLEEKANLVLNRLSDAKQVVIDIEGSGLDWKRNALTGIAFAFSPDPKDSYFIPIRQGGGENFSDAPPLSQAEEIPKVSAFEGEVSRTLNKNRECLIIGHNLKFDLHFLNQAGILVENPTECTRVNAALIDENLKKYRLEDCAIRASVEPKKGEILEAHIVECFGDSVRRNEKANLWRLSGKDKILNEYACGDATTTYQLWEYQKREIESQNLGVVWRLEKRMTQVLFDMERRGIRINGEQLERVSNDLDRMEFEAKKLLPKGFNPNSGSQVQNYLKKNRINDWPITEKGNPSFTEDFLMKFREGQNIIRLRKVLNLKNSFLIPLKERHLYKGRVHTTFNQLKSEDYGVVSGRLSSSDPNLQQVPFRNTELARVYRSIFYPEENRIWSSNDYTQHEFVIFAHYSRSPILIAGYNKNPPVDIHQIASDITGIPRYKAKRLNLGVLFGMSTKSLALVLEKSMEETGEIMSKMKERIPEAPSLRKRVSNKAKEQGWIRTFLNRRQRLDNPKGASKMMSRLIQGGCADMLKDKMVEIHDYFKATGKGELYLQTHDSLDWGFEEGNEKVNEEVKAIMTDFSKPPYELRLPLRIESSTGKNWAEASIAE